MIAASITCSSGHPKKTIAIIGDIGGWGCSPEESDMEQHRLPMRGYLLRCPCGRNVTAHKDDIHHALTEAHRIEGRTSLSLQAIATAKRWQGGIRRPEPIPVTP